MMKEVVTDELIEMIATNYQAYKNLMENVLGVPVMSFEDYMNRILEERNRQLQMQLAVAQ